MSSGPVDAKGRAVLPSALRDLPRFGFVRRSPVSHEESIQSDIIYGVRTVEELFEAAKDRTVSPKHFKGRGS